MNRNDRRVGGAEVDAHDEVIADDGIVEKLNFAEISDNEMMAYIHFLGAGSKAVDDAADSVEQTSSYPNPDPYPVIVVQDVEVIRRQMVQAEEDLPYQDPSCPRL